MRFWLIIGLFIPLVLFGQESKQQRKFYHMVDNLLDHSVEEIKVSDDIPSGTVILDARSMKEYQVSHLKNARFVGYDDFDLARVKDLEEDAEILVYCSVGYRSEKVAEQLKKAGYSKVKNLYGGLFDWANQEKEMVDSLGNRTRRIHGFDKTWGQWITGSEVVY